MPGAARERRRAPARRASRVAPGAAERSSNPSVIAARALTPWAKLSYDPPRIVDESLLPARSRVDRRRTRRVDPFESRRSALGRDRRRGFAARIGGSRLSTLRSVDTPLTQLRAAVQAASSAIAGANGSARNAPTLERPKKAG